MPKSAKIENSGTANCSRGPTIQTFPDKINAGKWLKPGAWGCKRKGATTQCAEGFALPFKRFLTRSMLGNGSNPVHGDAKRKGTTTQCAEAIFASFGAP